MIFQVDPDIAKASTIHTDFYTDADTFQHSREKIFARSWQFIGDTDRLNGAGHATPCTLLEGFIHESVLLTRDMENNLHCLSNVCTHRGAILIEKPCKLNDIRCRYHGRRFHLNGKILSMPEFKEVKNFPSEEDNLSTLPLYQWGKWLFTSLSLRHEAIDFFNQMNARIGWLPFDKFVFKPELSKDYSVNAHWALYCENYLEGFHIPFVHAGLNQVIDYGNYTTELFPFSNLQLGIAKEGELAFDLPSNSPDYGKNVAGYYFWVFPNMMFNFYPWGLSINIVKPIAIDKTIISFLTYVLDESKLEKGAGSDLHRVELEDEEVVESVQKGVRSRFYQHGRYSVTREQGTHHFHQLIARFMNEKGNS
jgi:choline monooxygenase